VLIDWFTVIAQIFNFLILVVLLKHFLYDRIIQAMDNREEKIQLQLEKAQKKEREAEQQAEKYYRERKDFEQKRKDLLSEVKEEAEDKRKELSRKAREEVGKIRIQWHQSLEREQAAFLREFRQLASQQVYAVSRKALGDLANKDLEEQIGDIFVSKIKSLTQEKNEKIAAAIQKEKTAIIRSGFEISKGLRQKIMRTIHEKMGADADISYKTDRDMIMGVELQSRGQKISWSLKNYLDELERKTREALEKESEKRETKQEKESQPRRDDEPSKKEKEREATKDNPTDDEADG